MDARARRSSAVCERLRISMMSLGRKSVITAIVVMIGVTKEELADTNMRRYGWVRYARTS